MIHPEPISTITLYLPKMGESIKEALVLNWCVHQGSVILEGDPLLEVATDKVDAEIPAPHSGTIQKLLVHKGAVVSIGAPIALLALKKEHRVASRQQAGIEREALGQATDHEAPAHASAPSFSLASSMPDQPLLSPLVKKMVQAHAMTHQEIVRLVRSKDRRVTKDALLAYLKRRKPVEPSHQAELPLYDGTIQVEQGDQSIKMDRLRKMIASRMVASKRIAPHVTSFMRVDVTDLVRWRQHVKAAFQAAYQVKLTYFSLFMAATARALKHFPRLNAVVRSDEMVLKKNINIGFAVALSDDNLVVPVIKKADQWTLSELAIQLNHLIEKAHDRQLSGDDCSDATYTISNIGSFNNLMGTPIIVQPQVAILAIGAIEQRPGIVQVHGEAQIAIRHEVFLSHTYDHRIIDGAIGGGFLNYLAKELAVIPSSFE